MKCDDYKQAIAAEPDELFAGGAAHSAECADCAAYGRSMRSLDALIARALQIEVPELHLPELPPLSGVSKVSRLPVRRLSTPLWLGLAASIAVAAILGIRMLTHEVVYPSLAAEIIAHLDHEPQALAVSDEAVADWRLDTVVGAYAEMDAGIGLVTYARTCVIHGQTVPHLVIQGESGPVTLILLPDETIDAAVPIEGERIHGVILPVGIGSIAIIGERGEALDQIEKRVIQSMQWKT